MSSHATNASHAPHTTRAPRTTTAPDRALDRTPGRTSGRPSDQTSGPSESDARVIALRPATAAPASAPAPAPAAKEPLWRDLVGDVLRRERLAQERTLKDVADAARISMPYLSEVERGRKEASSEVLAAAAGALGLGLADLLGLAQGELALLSGARRGPARTGAVRASAGARTVRASVGATVRLAAHRGAHRSDVRLAA